MRFGFLILSTILIFLVTINIELFFICPKFESDDGLTMKDTTFKFAFVFLRIAMVVVVFFLKDEEGGQRILRDLINCGLLFFLLFKHMHEFPYKDKKVQKISGGLLLWFVYIQLLELVSN